MWVLYELTDDKHTVTLYDDSGTAIPITGNPLYLDVATYTCDPTDKIGCSCDQLIFRKAQDIGKGKGNWPPDYIFPKANMVFINSTTGPFQTANEALP